MGEVKHLGLAIPECEDCGGLGKWLNLGGIPPQHWGGDGYTRDCDTCRCLGLLVTADAVELAAEVWLADRGAHVCFSIRDKSTVDWIVTRAGQVYQIWRDSSEDGRARSLLDLILMWLEDQDVTPTEGA